VLILGAGWSAAAGLPLANQLFDDTGFAGIRGSDADVIEAYEKWHRKYPKSSSEEFIAYAYDGRAEHVVRSLPGSPIFTLSGQLELDLTGGRPTYFGVSWREVAAYLQRRLAAPTIPPRSGGALRHLPALLRRTPSPEQARFWNELLEENTLVRAVLTTNYDLTPEQTIGIGPNVVPGSPGFHYAGIDVEVRPVKSPFGRDRSIDPCPSGVIPLVKLHGSLNWSHTPKGLEIFPDLRPAFRDGGDAAIVPPLPEKDVPPWLEPVWNQAQAELEQADEWVVVGYSLPPYDYVISSLFGHCGRRVRRVRIYDPYARDIADRWSAVAPNAVIETFPGLAPVAYGRSGAAGRLPRGEIERRRLRALSDPRVQRMMSSANRLQNQQHDHRAA
jgi:hypothetical protein